MLKGLLMEECSNTRPFCQSLELSDTMLLQGAKQRWPDPLFTQAGLSGLEHPDGVATSCEDHDSHTIPFCKSGPRYLSICSEARAVNGLTHRFEPVQLRQLSSRLAFSTFKSLSASRLSSTYLSRPERRKLRPRSGCEDCVELSSSQVHLKEGRKLPWP